MAKKRQCSVMNINSPPKSERINAQNRAKYPYSHFTLLGLDYDCYVSLSFPTFHFCRYVETALVVCDCTRRALAANSCHNEPNQTRIVEVSRERESKREIVRVNSDRERRKGEKKMDVKKVPVKVPVKKCW